MNTNINEASADEIPVIISLLKKLYTELGEEAESVRFVDNELVMDIINSGTTHIYLAKQEDIVVGIATLTECQSIYAGGRYGLLDEMYVLPLYRSTAIGKNLIEKAISVAKEKNWKRIDVTTPTEMRWKRTVDFYQGCGFIYTGQKLKLQLS